MKLIHKKYQLKKFIHKLRYILFRFHEKSVFNKFIFNLFDVKKNTNFCGRDDFKVIIYMKKNIKGGNNKSEEL